MTLQFNLKIAIFVMEAGLGGPVLAASIMSASLVATLVCGVLFQLMFKALKKFLMVFAPILMIFSVLLTVNAQSVAPLMISGFIAGFGSGIVMPYVQVKAFTMVPRATGAVFNSILMGSIMVIQLPASFFEKIVGIVTEATSRTVLSYSIYGYIIVIVVSVIYLIARPYRNLKPYVEEGEEAAAE